MQRRSRHLGILDLSREGKGRLQNISKWIYTNCNTTTNSGRFQNATQQFCNAVKSSYFMFCKSQPSKQSRCCERPAFVSTLHFACYITVCFIKFSACTSHFSFASQVRECHSRQYALEPSNRY
ncbi:uncharacterized protein LOC143462370 [Clavelina lepadiformis]|uniref:uncharacterized protein LOC143462370 n=1 Tax=Clavelina lepadiformis TaxID=159417 RepID=UPI0040427330